MSNKKDSLPKFPPKDNENPFVVISALSRLPKEEKELDKSLDDGTKAANEITTKKLFRAEVEEDDIAALGSAIDDALSHLDNLQEIRKLLKEVK